MRSGCLALFGLPFAAVGVVMTVLIARTLLESHAMAGWVEAPATIVETNLEQHRGSKGGTTHKVTARYTYATGVEREVHEGTRVGLHGGSDNLGSYHRDLYRKLSTARARGEKVPCYVNPADPAEAVLDRSPRPGMLAFYALFATVFGGVGFGLIAGGLTGARSAATAKSLERQAPAEPWRWRDDWNRGVLRADEGAAAKALIAAALFWNLISWSAALASLSNTNRSPGTVVLAIFPLIGLGLAWLAVVLWRRWRRFGATTLHLASTPVPPGGELVAGLRLPERIRDRKPVTLKLACVETETRGSGKHRKTITHEHWSASQVVEPEETRDLRGMLVPVRFQLPAGQPPADPRTSGDRVIWRLTVSSEIAGPDLHLTFELPVFHTPAPPAGSAGSGTMHA